MFEDDDLVMISALQHFMFCPRQCALIHIEQQWAENVYTIQGELLHKRVHSEGTERRPKKRKEFGMPVRSLVLGITGKTDAVEYGKDGEVRVVEFKRGRPKKGGMDEMQLCAQALCIEEMTGGGIEKGALYYGKQKRRKEVFFTEELRKQTIETIGELHRFLREGKTPAPVFESRKCSRCSLKGLCLPKNMDRKRSVRSYFERVVREDGQ